MIFWVLASVITICVVALILWPLLRERSFEASAQSPDVRVYRDQLTEVERDLQRGVLSEDEAERTRAEVSRRLLGADKEAQTARVGGRGPIGIVLVLVVALGVAAPGLYSYIGAVGAKDMPFATRDMAAEAARARPDQATVEAKVGDNADLAASASKDYLALVERLRVTVKKRPDDLKGQELLTQHEARLGHFVAAHKAKTRVIALKGDKADAADYAELAELMIVATGGYVSPQAEKALSKAINMDPTAPRARYFSGLDLAQNGRADLAYKIWSGLLAEGPADAPWIPIIRQQIGEVARLAGIAPDQSLPGPDAQQMKDAGKMSAQDRTKMIRSMVARLSDRLATDGGSAKEWTRLIRAYGVLGEAKKAAAAWADAKVALAGDASALAMVNAAAAAVGASD